MQIGIGQFSKLCGLSLRALRLYHELGLLTPDYVDEATGYRYYQSAQAEIAERIRLLRALEMPLEEIAGLLSIKDSRAAAEALAKHREGFAERARDYADALAQLDEMLKNAGPTYVVTAREIPAQLVLSVQESPRPDELPQAIHGAFNELYSHLRKRGVWPGRNSPFCIYGESDDEELLSFEACVPLDSSIPPDADGRCLVREVPSIAAACTVHQGSYEGLPRASQAILAWVEEKSLRLDGAPRHVYVVGPAQARQPCELRTEVAWPASPRTA